jgi:hypothetical protein
MCYFNFLFFFFLRYFINVMLNLIGDKNSLDAWSPKDNTIMVVLMVIFTFVIVVYLMNLFIGLLNNAIEEDNDRAFYLAQKAEVSKISKYNIKFGIFINKLLQLTCFSDTERH